MLPAVVCRPYVGIVGGGSLPWCHSDPVTTERTPGYVPFQPGAPSCYSKFDQAAAVHRQALDAHMFDYMHSRAQAEVLEPVRLSDGSVGARLTGESDAPVRAALALGDFVHNLRSGLDHLVWAAITSSGAEPQTWNTFPTARTEEEYRKLLKEKRPLDGTPDAFKEAVDDLRPWLTPKRSYPEQGAGHWLACLHRLDIADKHRLLLPVVVRHSGTVIVAGTDGREREVQIPLTPFGPNGLLYDGREGEYLRPGPVRSAWSGVEVEGLGFVHLVQLEEGTLMAVGVAAERLSVFL